MNLAFWNVDHLLSRVNLQVPKPIIDLTNITFFEPFALVYLGMYLRHHFDKTFFVEEPAARAPKEYLARVRFWERFNFDPETIRRENLRRFTSTTSFNDIVDIEKTDTIAEDIADGVLRILRVNSVKVNAAMVAESIAELVDNFAQHSQRSLAACALQYYPHLPHRGVVFAIGDCGIGIRKSLSSNPKYAYLSQKPHSEAEPLRLLSPWLPEGLRVELD